MFEICKRVLKAVVAVSTSKGPLFTQVVRIRLIKGMTRPVIEGINGKEMLQFKLDSAPGDLFLAMFPTRTVYVKRDVASVAAKTKGKIYLTENSIGSDTISFPIITDKSYLEADDYCAPIDKLKPADKMSVDAIGIDIGNVAKIQKILNAPCVAIVAAGYITQPYSIQYYRRDKNSNKRIKFFPEHRHIISPVDLRGEPYNWIWHEEVSGE